MSEAADAQPAPQCMLRRQGFGPLRQLVESLPTDRREQLKRDLDAYHSHYAVSAGLHLKREYLLIIGRRL